MFSCNVLNFFLNIITHQLHIKRWFLFEKKVYFAIGLNLRLGIQNLRIQNYGAHCSSIYGKYSKNQDLNELIIKGKNGGMSMIDESPCILYYTHTREYIEGWEWDGFGTGNIGPRSSGSLRWFCMYLGCDYPFYSRTRWRRGVVLPPPPSPPPSPPPPLPPLSSPNRLPAAANYPEWKMRWTIAGKNRLEYIKIIA